MNRLQTIIRGGARYRKARDGVLARLGASSLDGFFIGVDRQLNLGSGFNPRNWRRDEYAVALTGDRIILFKLEKPSLVASKIQEKDREVGLRDVAWNGSEFRVPDLALFPFPFHRSDAEEVAKLIESRLRSGQ